MGIDDVSMQARYKIQARLTQSAYQRKMMVYYMLQYMAFQYIYSSTYVMQDVGPNWVHVVCLLVLIDALISGWDQLEAYSPLQSKTKLQINIHTHIHTEAICPV